MAVCLEYNLLYIKLLKMTGTKTFRRILSRSEWIRYAEGTARCADTDRSRTDAFVATLPVQNHGSWFKTLIVKNDLKRKKQILKQGDGSTLKGGKRRVHLCVCMACTVFSDKWVHKKNMQIHATVQTSIITSLRVGKRCACCQCF